MRHKLKKIASFFLVSSLVFILAIGLIFSAEILWRSFGPVATRGTLIDVALFPYKHYMVTTHPGNLELGKSDHILEKYFSKNVCAKEGIVARFNSEGFRTHDLDSVPNKEPGEIRIIITGGSASISWNIGEACTLDNHLYKLFAKHYPNKKVRIFNLGNGAWKSFQELIAIQLYGLKLQPDLIIAFDGFNDIQHSYSMPIDQPYTNHAETAFKKYQYWVLGRVSELFKTLKIVKALKDPSILPVGMVGRAKAHIIHSAPEFAAAAKPGQLATQMHYPLDLSAIKNRTDFDPYNQEAVNFYLSNEHLLGKAAGSVNAKLMVVLQPILYLKTPLSPSEQTSLESYAASVNFVVQGYERMKEGLQKLAQEENNIIFYDMSNAFKHQSHSFFGDYCHFSAEGYEIVANQLFTEIEKNLVLQ